MYEHTRERAARRWERDGKKLSGNPTPAAERPLLAFVANDAALRIVHRRVGYRGQPPSIPTSLGVSSARLPRHLQRGRLLLQALP